MDTLPTLLRLRPDTAALLSTLVTRAVNRQEFPVLAGVGIAGDLDASVDSAQDLDTGAVPDITPSEALDPILETLALLTPMPGDTHDDRWANQKEFGALLIGVIDHVLNQTDHDVSVRDGVVGRRLRALRQSMVAFQGKDRPRRFGDDRQQVVLSVDVVGPDGVKR